MAQHEKIIIPLCAIALSIIAPSNTAAYSKGGENQIQNDTSSVSAKSRSTSIAEDIEKRVKKVIIKCLDLAENEVTLNSKLADDLAADSLDIVEIVIEIEKEFKIVIPDDDVDNIVTVKDAVDYVKGVLNAKK